MADSRTKLEAQVWQCKLNKHPLTLPTPKGELHSPAHNWYVTHSELTTPSLKHHTHTSPGQWDSLGRWSRSSYPRDSQNQRAQHGWWLHIVTFTHWSQRWLQKLKGKEQSKSIPEGQRCEGRIKRNRREATWDQFVKTWLHRSNQCHWGLESWVEMGHYGTLAA